MSRRIRDILINALLPFTIAAIATCFVLLAAGNLLGLYFGGTVTAILILPPLVARHDDPFEAFIAAGSVIDGVGVVWLIAALLSPTTLAQWLAAYLVLAACGLGVFALGMLIRCATRSTASAAITVVVALSWLTVPIWLAPAVAARLSVIHPLMALNRVFIEQGVWTQQRLMYQLSTLGQDVPYSLPSSIFPCVFAHGLMAVSLGWPAWWLARRAEWAARRQEASPAT